MRSIQKEISLEQVTSRLPSVWPAYRDNSLYFFDEESLSGRSMQYTSNYGMVPMNIVLESMPSSSYTIVSGDCANAFIMSFETLSNWYHFFIEYYNLLTKYGHCKRVYTSAVDYYNYESLPKYSDKMVYGSNKQTYINLDNEFAEKGGVVLVKVFDKRTSEYSWVTPVEAHDEGAGDDTAIVDVKDDGFYKWICENVVPSFVIPMEYRSYWNRERLFYPDALKWIAWFKERTDYEEVYESGSTGEVESWNCKDSAITDCCDCEEYFNRGGERLLGMLEEWFSGTQESINAVKDIVMSSTSDCFTPRMELPLELQISIDDLGEKSIFSNEYELGVDYRTIKTESGHNVTSIFYENGNTNSGTVATIDGEPMILVSGTGSEFSSVFMEKYVSSCLTCGYEGVFVGKCPKCGEQDKSQIHICGWMPYTDYYISGNTKDFYITSSITYYTFDENNVKYTSSADTYDDAEVELRDKLSKKYKINTREGGWLLIDDMLYEIDNSEYGIYDKKNKYLGGKKFLVYREDFTNTPYTFVNGSKIYSEYDEYNGFFYFPFFKEDDGKFKRFKRFGETEDVMPYIEYGANTYEVSGDTLIVYSGDSYVNIDLVNGYRPFKISGYSEAENGDAYFCEEYSGFVFNRSNEKGLIRDENASATSNNTLVIGYEGYFPIYTFDELTGRTVSKLADLKRLDVLNDDIGNDLDALYVVSDGTLNHQPPEGSELELIYQVGNTANITAFSQTKEDMNELLDNNSVNYFIGDILMDMSFYYKDTVGNVVEETRYTVTFSGNDKTVLLDSSGNVITASTELMSLSAISYASSARSEMDCNEISGDCINFSKDIYCDVTYYVGATLSRRSGSPYNLATEARNDEFVNHGIEYKETVRFVKDNREYYLKLPIKKKYLTPNKFDSVSAHSVSYPVIIYVLTQEQERVKYSEYATEYAVPMATFKYPINIWQEGSEQDTFSRYYNGDTSIHNNLQVYPTFREEYRLSSSAIENIDTDIYIDRGINAAFEKHLKLGEVTSLEALEQYGNNFFKIMNN